MALVARPLLAVMNLNQLADSLVTAVERHQLLRKPTGLQFVISDRIDLMHPTLWRQLTEARGLMMSAEYLRALERAEIPTLQTRYALVFDGTQPIAALSMQIYEVSVDRLHAQPMGAPVPPFARLEEQLRQRALICGNALSYGLDGVAFAPDVAAETRWRAVAEVLYRVRRAEKLQGHTNFVLIKDLTDEQLRDSHTLRSLSYRPMETEPNMVLTLEPAWRTHADYLGSMTSKFRSSVKNAVLQPIVEAGCMVDTLSLEEVTRESARIHQLYLSVQNNAAVRPVTVSPRYWVEMAALGPQRCVFKAIRREGALLGFLLIQLDRDTATAAQVGFDREAAKALPVYLRLLHTTVETALEHQKTRVVFGRTALEPKARMGARPVNTSMWVRHRVPLVNALMRNAVGLIEHADAPAIEPFKRAPVSNARPT